MDIESDTTRANAVFDILSNLFRCACLSVCVSVRLSVSGALGLPAAHNIEARLRSLQDLLREGKGCRGRRMKMRAREAEGEEEENVERGEAGR